MRENQNACMLAGKFKFNPINLKTEFFGMILNTNMLSLMDYTVDLYQEKVFEVGCF